MVVSRSQIIAPGYGDLTLGGVELEEVKCLRSLGARLDSFAGSCVKGSQESGGRAPSRKII